MEIVHSYCLHFPGAIFATIIRKWSDIRQRADTSTANNDSEHGCSRG